MNAVRFVTVVLLASTVTGVSVAKPADPAGIPRSCEHRFERALTGHLDQPLIVRVSCIGGDDQPRQYAFADRNGWHRGKTAWDTSDPPSVFLVDLDFDGHADLWVTGCRDGQCRIADSDVWRYDARSRGFVFDSTLSGLANLAVDPGRRRLRAGVFDCGCAASCYDLSLYTWEAGKLNVLARHTADCEHYREYTAADTGLIATREERHVIQDHFDPQFTPLDERRGWRPGLVFHEPDVGH